MRARVIALLLLACAATCKKTDIPRTLLVEFISKCNYRNEDFWKTYFWNFGNASTIRLVLLTSKGTEVVVEEYFSLLFQFMYMSKWYRKTYVIMRHELEFRDVSVVENLAYVNQHCPNTNTTKININSNIIIPVLKVPQRYVMQQRIRRFSADLDNAYVIIVWNYDYLRRFMEAMPKEVVQNPRGVYMVIFLTPNPMTSVYEEGFRKIWNTFGVLNIIWVMPCSCLFKKIYMFNPFVENGEKWGRLKVFRINDALLYPYKYRNSLRNLGLYPMRVSMFYRIPTVVKLPKSLDGSRLYRNLTRTRGYVGMDAMLLLNIAEYLNFEPNVTNSGGDYGYKEGDVYYNSLGDVVHQRVDVSFNSRFVLGTELDVIEYTTPVINDEFCLLVPKALKVPQWRMLFRCFTPKCWALILVTYLLAGTYWYVVQPVGNASQKRKLSAFLDVFCVLITIPICLGASKNHKLFFSGCLMFSIIVIGTFQGLLVRNYSTPSYYPDIDTLEEFEKSGLIIESPSKSLENVFGDDGTGFFTKLSSRIRVLPKINGVRRVVENKNVAVFERRSDIMLRVSKMYLGKDFNELIHIMKQCPRSFHFTYIVPKGSPYLHVFNIVVTQFREAGLLIKWNRDISNSIILETKVKETPTKSSAKVFSLEDMKIAFYCLVTGFILSSMAFIAELFQYRKNSKKIK